MHRWIGRYATEKGISYDDVLVRISWTDVATLEEKAAKYVADRDFSDEANEMLRLYNLKMRVSRAELLRREVAIELIALGSDEERRIGGYLSDEYMDEITRQAGILNLSKKSAEELRRNVQNVVDSSWRGATWSQRVWKNNEDLRSRLEIGLRSTMMQGDNPRDWARRLRQVLDHEMLPRKGRDNAIFRTERLAITEAGRVQIEAQLSSFQAGGYEELEIITEPGACSHCLPHDGEIVKLSEARMDENIPMFHPFCRCSTAAHMSREALEREFEAHGFLRMSEREIEAAWQKKKTYAPKNDLTKIPQFSSTIEIKHKVQEGVYNLTLRKEQYEKHFAGTKQYESYKMAREKRGWGVQGRLIITRKEAQDLIYKYYGTGIVMSTSKGVAKSQELINFKRKIGYYVLNGIEYFATKGMIVYGKRGAHIIPIRGDNFD